MSVEGPAAVVDTNVFGAELTRRGAPVAGAYRDHVQDRALFICFVTVQYGGSGEAGVGVVQDAAEVLDGAAGVEANSLLEGGPAGR